MIKWFERRRFIIICSVVLFLSLCVLVAHQTDTLDTIRVRIGDLGKDISHAVQKEDPPPKEESKEEPQEDDKFKHKPRPTYLDAPVDEAANKDAKSAYVTFLTDNGSADEDLENDHYLQATRVLIWQLLHVPKTRTKHDVIVMVTPNVTQSRRDRLEKDGAIIHPVELLHTDNDGWMTFGEPRWSEVLTKLRVWEMTQYSKILMLDGDSMIREPLDGVFDDPGAQPMVTKPTSSLKGYEPTKGMPPPPETYLVAGLSETWDSNHAFPPAEGTGLKDPGKFNAGFFLIAPSLEWFNWYVAMLDIPHSFDSTYPEQNLLNQIHSWDGPMPWREVDYKWNARYPNENDFAHGLVSVHEKWWEQKYVYDNEKVKHWLRSQRWEMKGWYDGREAAEKAAGGKKEKGAR